MKEQAKVIRERWDYSSKGYSDMIQAEFTEAGDVWSRLLLENAPNTGKKALDVGTGPGFFAMLLAMEGFEVTAVDCSENMVRQARENAAERGLAVDFRVMDSHELAFADNSFDYIVLRNATWLLYEPKTAFAEWLRVLRPGGRLLYLDANWSYKDDPELLRRMDEANARYEKEHGRAFNSYTGSEELTEKAYKLSAFQHVLRPAWDLETLPALGYCSVSVTPRMNEQIYPPWKQTLYDCMDEFLVTAEKPR